jgi:hypothetical protein
VLGGKEAIPLPRCTPSSQRCGARIVGSRSPLVDHTVQVKNRLYQLHEGILELDLDRPIPNLNRNAVLIAVDIEGKVPTLAEVGIAYLRIGRVANIALGEHGKNWRKYWEIRHIRIEEYLDHNPWYLKEAKPDPEFMLFKTNDVRQALSRITAKRNVNGLLEHIFRALNFGEKLFPAEVGGGLGSESLSATTASHGALSTFLSLVADQTNALGSLNLSSGRSTGAEDHAEVGGGLGSEGLGVTTAPHDEEDDEEKEDDNDILLLRRFCADQLEGKACKEKDSCKDFLSICEAFARGNGGGCGEPGSHLVNGKMMYYVRRTYHAIVKRIPC